MAHVLATFGQFERRLIGQRTKEALAAKKASGVRLGRPPTIPLGRAPHPPPAGSRRLLRTSADGPGRQAVVRGDVRHVLRWQCRAGPPP
jgi:DNA invertase Pin-like site-specific DNA recombinase